MRYTGSSYTVATIFFPMLIDNRLTSPVRNGTVLGVGMTRHVYAWTTQMASSYGFKNKEAII